jgi:hypothetical protein
MGLQSVPLLNRIFGQKVAIDESNEVVIAMTPHILRAPILEEEDLRPMAIGTDEVKRVQGARTPLLGLVEPTPAPSPTPPPPNLAPTARPGPAPSPAAVPPTAPGPLGEPIPPTPDDKDATANGPVEAPPLVKPATPGAGGMRAQFAPQAATVKPGDIGALSVILVGGRDLLAVDLALAYDPGVIEPVDMAPGALLSLDGAQVTGEKQAENGRYRARFSRGTTTSGAGAVAVFTFRGLKPGNASLAVSELTVSTPNGIQRVEVGGPVRVTVQP